MSYDPDDQKGDIVFKTAPPKESGGQSCTNGTDNDGDGLNDASDPDCVKLSVNKPGPSNPDPLRLSIVDPDPTSSPLVLDARVTDISDELRGKLISKDVDGEGGLGPSKCSNGVDDDSDADETGGGTDAADDDCEKDLAQMVFNACPTGSDIETVASGCPGIGAIEFKATNALVGDPLPQPVPSTSSIGGVTQDFSFIQRADLFRAQGTISQLKKIGLSQVDKSAQANPSATTRIGAAFGSGAPTEKIRAYVDTDCGAEQLLADAVISEAPAGIEVCLRDAIPTGSDFAQNASSDIYCDTAAPNQLALQAALTQPSTTNKPDIDIRQLRVALGRRHERPDRQRRRSTTSASASTCSPASATPTATSASRATRSSDDNHAPSTSRPRQRRRPHHVRPAQPRLGSEHRQPVPVAVARERRPQPDRRRRHDRRRQRRRPGRQRRQLPEVRHRRRGALQGEGLGARHQADRQAQGRVRPERPALPGERVLARRSVPEYQCLEAAVAGGKKLGLNVRTLDAKNEVLEVEEGHITAVPSGGLKVTLGKSPDAAKLDPICGAAQGPDCRPPMLSLEAPRGGAAVPRLRARLSTGAKDLVVGKLLREAPADDISQFLDYEQAPKDFAGGGRAREGRHRQGADGSELLGIRLNANLPLHQFLDLDPPTLWSCVHTVVRTRPGRRLRRRPGERELGRQQGL